MDPDPETFNCIGLDWNQIATLPEDEIEAIPRGADIPSRKDGTLVVGSDSAVYILEACQRRWIPDPETFNRLGLDWSVVQTISDADLNAIPRGPDIS